jgi:hypothetical protein
VHFDYSSLFSDAQVEKVGNPKEKIHVICMMPLFPPDQVSVVMLHTIPAIDMLQVHVGMILRMCSYLIREMSVTIRHNVESDSYIKIEEN